MTTRTATVPPAHATQPERVPPPRLATVRALVVRGLRDNRRAWLSWGVPLGAFCMLIVAVWPSIEDSIGQALEGYPEALKQAFNIERLDTAEAYLDAEMFSLIVPLALAFFAVRCAIRPLVTAEEQRHLDTVLATPLSRRVLAGASFGVTAVSLASILVVIWALTMLAGVLVGVDLSPASVAAGVAGVWPISLFFAGLAILLAGLMHRAAPVTAIAAGTLAAMYVVDLVGKISEPLEPLRYASAFRYYGSAIQDGIDPAAFVGLVVVGAALAACGAELFERRDVYA